MRLVIWIAALLGLAGATQAQTRSLDGAPDGPGWACSDGLYGPVQCLREAHQSFDLCQALAATARDHFLDEGFFARLIWQDSRLDPNRINAAKLVADPVLNSDKPGLGVVTRHLNPLQILERTGRYIAYLKQEDGNIGLAAMAYDAGERGAFGFMAGNVRLRPRSADFVQLVTGVSAETWRNDPPLNHDFRLSAERSFMEVCLDLAKGQALRPPHMRFAPWGVQLGHGFGKNRATLEQARLCPSKIEAKLEYVPLQHRFAGQRALWAARLAASTRAEALQHCAQLTQNGCPCRVVKNP